MRNKIIGWSIVGLAVLICWAGIRSDNHNREVRRDFAFCRNIKLEQSEVSSDIATFCDKVFSDNAARAQAQKDHRRLYLTERAKESS